VESVFNPGDYFAPPTVGPSFRLVIMLGELVQTTTAKWITQKGSGVTGGFQARVSAATEQRNQAVTSIARSRW